MTEEAADAAIDQACRMLRIPTIRNSFTEYADRAGHEQMSYRGFLAELLLAECDDRSQSSITPQYGSNREPRFGGGFRSFGQADSSAATTVR